MIVEAFNELFNDEESEEDEVILSKVSLKLFLRKLNNSLVYSALLGEIENEDVTDELGKNPTVESLVKFLRSEGN